MKSLNNIDSLTIDEKLIRVRKSINIKGELIAPETEFTDYQLITQLETLKNQKVFATTDEFAPFAKTIVNELSTINLSNKLLNEFVKQKVFTFFGWKTDGNKLIPLTEKFIKAFHNMWILKKYYPAEYMHFANDGGYGLDEILSKHEQRALKSYDAVKQIQKLVSIEINLKQKLKQGYDYKNVKGFDSLNSFDTKNIELKKHAKTFYLNRNNTLEERWNVFLKYGARGGWIHHPTHPTLNILFENYHNTDFHNRGQEIEVSYVLEYWGDNIEECKENDGKSISKAAIDKMYKYFQEVLMIEGTAAYFFDW